MEVVVNGYYLVKGLSGTPQKALEIQSEEQWIGSELT